MFISIIYNDRRGGYCGVTGTSLGLSGSESGVNYQLYRGTTAVGSPVPGTGNALSFGTANTIGEYTVVASKSFVSLLLDLFLFITIVHRLHLQQQ